MKPTESKIKITTKQHHEFTFNGVTKKRSIDGRDTVYIVEEGLDTFTIESPNEKLNGDQAMLYVAVSMLSLDPKKGYQFEVVEDKTNKAGISLLQRDGILETVKLHYNHDKTNEICDLLCVPKKAGTNEYLWSNANRVQVTVYALEKAFKMYDTEQPQNDIVAIVEQVSPDLVVTTFEELPSVEKTKVDVDLPNDSNTKEPFHYDSKIVIDKDLDPSIGDAMRKEMLNYLKKQKEQPPKDDYQQLLDDIENVIDIVSNDKLPYHERARANRVLSVYFDRLNKYVHDTHVDSIKAENKADKEYYRLYYEFLEDPKNVAENGKKPSDASAKAYATNLTLDLYQDAKLSEALLKYLQSRLRSLNSIFEGVRQEVSNDKKIEEQTKTLK